MASVLPAYLATEPRSELRRTTKSESLLLSRTSTARPVSTTSDQLDTEFEDDSDIGDGDSWKSSVELDRRRSGTTVSSYDEVPTPDSSRSSTSRRQFDLHIKSVEGPRGPHLFRSSSTSADFDYALQMSPLLPKEMPRRPQTTFHDEAVTPTTRQRQQDFTIAAALAAPELQSNDPESQIRQWGPMQVIDWMYSCGMDASVIECFEANDINGKVLLDLTFEHLRDQLGIQSFGKRHELWSAISSLKGHEAQRSRQGTPFLDISRPCTTIERHSSPRSAGSFEEDGQVTPIDNAASKKRRGRKASKENNSVLPAESVSIVAIEQLIPKPHKCHKGERCAKWRKQQRELKQLQDEGVLGQFPVSPTKGGRIHIYGDPGNAGTAANVVPNCRKQVDDTARLTTDTMPSLVASSDVLGPGQMPEFALHEDSLDRLGNRDPQDNVRQFLNFQHVESPVDPAQPAMIPRATSVPPMFPEYHHQAYPSMVPPRNSQTPGPRNSLKSLPRLEIPRCQSVAPESATSVYHTPNPATSPCRSANVSPSMVYRFGTPQSEMDVPLTAIPTGPISREMTQSVPPNMLYRQNSPLSRSSPARSATSDLRRPSMPLPALKENEVLLSASDSASSLSSQRPSSRPSQDSGSPQKVRLDRTKSIHDPKPGEPAVKYFSYGEDCSHAGYMKKRKTRLLRHEWQEGHFRLIGSQLSMHENARLTSAPLEKINVEDYGVACSTAVSTGKLSAAMKAFHIKSQSAGADKTAFNFQLIPASDKKAALSAKTHHFAVKNKDDRIDWMRELMLAKALQQKGKGYDVEVNGKKF